MPHDGNIDRTVFSLEELRNIVLYQDQEVVQFLPAGDIYVFNAISSRAEDGNFNIKPADVNHLVPGRWEKTDLRFGANYQRADSMAVSSTTSATASTKVQLNVPQGRRGTYRLAWEAKISVSNVTANIEITLLDGTTVLQTWTMEAPDVSVHLAAGDSLEVLLDSAPRFFRIQFRKASGAGSVSIENAVLELWRKGA